MEPDAEPPRIIDDAVLEKSLKVGMANGAGSALTNNCKPTVKASASQNMLAIRITQNDGTEQVKIKNLKVLKGVALSGYEDAGDAFIINAELGAGGKSIDMKLIDAKGTPRYQASAESIDWKRAPLDFAGLTGDLAPAPWAPEDFYGDDTLFHGEAFQVLRSIEGVGEQGARATLVGLKSKGWSEDFWATDAALIDGCLQLALLLEPQQPLTYCIVLK